ncbi:hypothetical protein AMTRI_Chr02g253730 [Amborella trichopoda]
MGRDRIMIPLPANAYFSLWSTLGMGSCFLNSENAFISLFDETSRLDMVAASSTSTTKEHYTKTNYLGGYQPTCSNPYLIYVRNASLALCSCKNIST